MIRRFLRRLRGRAPAPPPPAPRVYAPYAPLRPEAWTLDGAFDAAFLAAGGDVDRLLAGATSPHPGLWALRVLDAAWCAALREEVSRYEAWAAANGVHVPAPNTMNRYGLILDSTVGEEALQPPLLDLAPLRRALMPLTTRLFPEVGGGALDAHHGFVVRYALTGDRDLGFHADDAEVTLNVCLGGGFTGGDLWFEGRRCFQHHDDAARPGEPYTWRHAPGLALLHAGAHRHGARPITAGSRDNLILWMRAGGWRAAEDPALGLGDTCPPWCGAHRAGR